MPDPEMQAKMTSKRKKKDYKEGELFTPSQVRRIVQEAVEQREAQLREEYDKKLNMLLQEQFEQFTRFNQDYISRQMNRTTPDYIS